MRNPAKVYTKSGLVEYNANLYQLDRAVNYFINQEDDLHLDERFMERLWEMREYLFNNLSVLEQGDGEDEEEEADDVETDAAGMTDKDYRDAPPPLI